MLQSRSWGKPMCWALGGGGAVTRGEPYAVKSGGGINSSLLELYNRECVRFEALF